MPLQRKYTYPLKTIGDILKRYTGEVEEPKDNEMSTDSKAFKMFKENRSKVDVAICLNLNADEVESLFKDYLKLLNLDRIMVIYRLLGDKFDLFYHLFNLMEEAGLLSRSAIARFVQTGGRLVRLEEEWFKESDLIRKLKERKAELEKKIEEMTSLLHYMRTVYARLKKSKEDTIHG